MLDRIGDEVARATSVVRYAPNGAFPRHVHAGGEELFVLDGVFSDEWGDFGPGTYVRNPRGTGHAPFTRLGATIFVKLWQFEPGDDRSLVVDTRTAAFSPGLVEGVTVLPLHQYNGERVALVRWRPGTRFQRHTHVGGEEIFVIDGEFADEHGRYPAGTWLRDPHRSSHTPFSDTGCLIYVKTGHLVEGASVLLAPDQRSC